MITDRSDQFQITGFTEQMKGRIISKWSVADMFLVELGSPIQRMIIQLIEDIVLEEVMEQHQGHIQSNNNLFHRNIIL